MSDEKESLERIEEKLDLILKKLDNKVQLDITNYDYLQLKTIVEDNTKLVMNGNKLKDKFLSYALSDGPAHLYDLINNHMSIEFKPSDIIIKNPDADFSLEQLRTIVMDNKKLVMNGNELKRRFLGYVEDTDLRNFINSIEFKLSV